MLPHAHHRRAPAPWIFALTALAACAVGDGDTGIDARADRALREDAAVQDVPSTRRDVAADDIAADDAAEPGDVAVAPRDAASPCESLTTCAECPGRAGCGWCASTSRCMSGSPTRSDDGSCTGSDWIYSNLSCPGGTDTCTSSSSCATCTPRSGCGWCRTTNRCQSGTSTGSADGRCTGGNWSWVSSSCP